MLITQEIVPSTADLVSTGLQSIPSVAFSSQGAKALVTLSLNATFFAADLVAAGLNSVASSLRN